MLDTRLEERLRAALTSAGDDLQMTITPAELERRLATRRRQRNGQRWSLAAAAVAILAVGSIVAISNGWIPGPAVQVGASPSITPIPSASTSPSGARSPIGGPADAVIVAQLPEAGAPDERLQVTLVHADLTTTPIATFDETAFPAGTHVSLDHPMRVGPTGYLLVQLLDQDENPAGAILYDLHAPAAEPQVFTDPNIVDWIWSPTGTLAADLSDRVAISDPAHPAVAPVLVTVPSNVSLATNGPGRGLAWAADGQGFIADRDDSNTVSRGVLGLDGTFTVNPSPPTYAATGLERGRDPNGEALTLGCADDATATTPATCVVTSSVPSVGENRQWYSPAPYEQVQDQIWSADGTTIWLLVDDQDAGATTRNVRVLSGGPAHYDVPLALTEVAPPRSGGRTAFAGLAPDDGHLVVDLGTGEALFLDVATGLPVSFPGQFAGWADTSRGFGYPGTPVVVAPGSTPGPSATAAEPTPEPTLGPPPSLPADLAPVAWVRVQDELVRNGQFGFAGYGTSQPYLRRVGVDGDHVANVTDDPGAGPEIAVYQLLDPGPDQIGPIAIVSAATGMTFDDVWLDDRHGQLFYSTRPLDGTGGVIFHRIGLTEADRADTVIATAPAPLGADGSPLGGVSAALSTDHATFVVETCQGVGCELQVVDTSTLKATTATVSTDGGVCTIIGVVAGQVFTTTADVCAADAVGAPGSIQAVPITGGSAKTVLEGNGFDSFDPFAIDTAAGPRIIYTRDWPATGQALTVLDPATGISVAAPIDALKGTATTFVVADRGSNLPPGWLLIRRVDQDGNGIAVPQLVSLDTTQTFDVPNVPR